MQRSRNKQETNLISNSVNSRFIYISHTWSWITKSYSAVLPNSHSDRRWLFLKECRGLIHPLQEFISIVRRASLGSPAMQLWLNSQSHHREEACLSCVFWEGERIYRHGKRCRGHVFVPDPGRQHMRNSTSGGHTLWGRRRTFFFPLMMAASQVPVLSASVDVLHCCCQAASERASLSLAVMASQRRLGHGGISQVT